MIQSLKALNPLNYFFTGLDYEDSLIEIEAMLKGLDSFPDTFQKNIERLEKTYALGITCLKGSGRAHPDKPLSLLFAEILRRYSLISLSAQPFAAKQLLLASLNFHLHAAGIDTCRTNLRDFPTLEDLKTKLARNTTFYSSFESEMLKMRTEYCVLMVHTDTFALPDKLQRHFNLAETARWLGNSYQKLDASLADNEENNLRFTKLFSLSESLYLFAGEEASVKKALAALYLNAYPFMHLRNNPKDIAGALAFVQRAKACDPSIEMNVRANLQRYLLANPETPSPMEFESLEAAVSLAAALEDTDEARALSSEIKYHYASYLLLPEALDIDKAERLLKESLDFAAAKRLSGTDSIDFALYDLKMGELQTILNDLPEAAICVRRAINTLQNSPESHSSLLLKAQALQQIISNRTALQPVIAP